MDGWKYWEGRKVFIILKNKRQYSGIVLEVEEDKATHSFYFITIKDKFDNRISFINTEIELIQEEKGE